MTQILRNKFKERIKVEFRNPKQNKTGVLRVSICNLRGTLHIGKSTERWVLAAEETFSSRTSCALQ